MHHFFWKMYNNFLLTKKCIYSFLIADELVFTTHPQSQSVREKSDEVKFSSNAHGIPEPVYFWTRDGKMLTDESVGISFSRDKKELKITNVQRTDSGEYQCVASNKVNDRVTSIPAMLTVKCKNTFAYLILEPSRLVHVCFKRALLLGFPCQGTPRYNFGFRSSVQKNGHPGEGRHEGLVPRNDILISGFIFPCTDPCTNILCTSPPPPPPETQKALRIKKAIWLVRSDSIIAVTL